MSPVGTVLEARVLRWMCDLAGFGPDAGGTFTSGGTEATFTALLAARAAALPNAWKEGVGASAARSSSTASTPTTPWRGPSARWDSGPTTP